MSIDAITIDGTFHLKDGIRQTIVDGTTLSGTVQFNLATIDGTNPVADVVITGTVPAGVTFDIPLNMPKGIVTNYYFVNPGTNTPTFINYVNVTQYVNWTAGLGALYQIKRLAIDGTPANDKYLISSNLQGGAAVGSSSLYSIPASGVEIVVGDLAGSTIYRQRFTGSMPTTNLKVLGSPTSGNADKIVNWGGEINPVSLVQKYVLPGYTVDDNDPNPDRFNISLQRHNNNTFRMIVGSSLRNASYLYDLWIDYTKI